MPNNSLSSAKDGDALHDSDLLTLLKTIAQKSPNKNALVCNVSQNSEQLNIHSYSDLYKLTTEYINGLTESDIGYGSRVLMMVTPSVDFAAIVFALNKIGAVPILIDPGMGIIRLLKCIKESSPTAMIGIPKAFILKTLFSSYFSSVKTAFITSPKFIFRSAKPLSKLRSKSSSTVQLTRPQINDLGAIVFTSGSTGIPKGVELSRKQILAQRQAWNNGFSLTETDIELITFPTFILPALASGRTCIIPETDFSKPAKANAVNIVNAINTYNPTFTFGSPSLWLRIIEHCKNQNVKLDSLRCIITGGAPIPYSTINNLKHLACEASVYIAYGATEALPISAIEHTEIKNNTKQLSQQGWGTCVGYPIKDIAIKIIKNTDDIIEKWNDNLELSSGEVGEIIVKGPFVTEHYFNRPVQTKESKIYETKDNITYSWHRTGDIGYIDGQGRIWICSRKTHQIKYQNKILYPVQAEEIFNTLDNIKRTALVGIQQSTNIEVALIIELEKDKNEIDLTKLTKELQSLKKRYNLPVKHFILYPKLFPVDRRHNAKIERLELAAWANKHLTKGYKL